MSVNTRLLLIKIHLVLAALLLPAIATFAVTGGLYTWGTKGDYRTTRHTLAVNGPLAPDVDALTALVERELAARGLPRPSGETRVRKVGGAFQFEWSGAGHDVVLIPADAGSATLEFKRASPYQRLVQLHKAKGATFFKAYASVMAATLLLLLLTGVIMGWQMPKYRGLVGRSLLAGAALYALAVALG